VDVDTVRYVPHALVRAAAEVPVGETEVIIFDGAQIVARHRRSNEPHARVIDPRHFDGLWRRADADSRETTPLPAGRSLADYAAQIGGVASASSSALVSRSGC
jgi:hypothetical protein